MARVPTPQTHTSSLLSLLIRFSSFRLDDVVREFDNVTVIRNNEEFMIVFCENVTVIYATREETPKPRHHLTIIGIVKDDRIEPLIMIGVVGTDELAPPIMKPRLRVEKRGDVIFVEGTGVSYGLTVREYGMLRVTPAVPVLIANAPWRSIPPAEYPSPAYVLQKLLTVYIEEVVLRGSDDKWWLLRDSHAINIIRTAARQRKLLWASRYTEVENPLYYAARALRLADKLLYST